MALGAFIGGMPRHSIAQLPVKTAFLLLARNLLSYKLKWNAPTIV
jgi:hypothetical protein